MAIDSGWAGLVLGGYLLGSIPFGVVAARCLGGIDPRSAGSRNIGFTNVLRLSGKKVGAVTLAGDMGKGWLVGWGAQHILEQEAAVLVVAFSVVAGHVFSVFLRFQGGKGVATGFGAIAGVAPWLGLAIMGIWLLVVGLFRYSAGGAVVSFAVLPVLAGLWGQGGAFIVFCVLVSGLVLYRHQENMVRLWKGTEPQMGRPSRLS